MSLPGYTAENSLYKTREYYQFASTQTEYLDGQGLVAPTQMTGGDLMGAFCFDTLGRDPFPVTVYVQGQLVQASPPMGGRTNFSLTQQSTVSPGGVKCVGFNVSGLQAGTWNVRARANTTGSAGPCPARVPGYIRLGVSGGQGPWCG